MAQFFLLTDMPPDRRTSHLHRTSCPSRVASRLTWPYRGPRPLLQLHWLPPHIGLRAGTLWMEAPGPHPGLSGPYALDRPLH